MTPEEKREYMREWKRVNRDQVRAYERDYYSKNRDSFRVRQKGYQLRTLPAFNARSKVWTDANPEKALLRAARCRAKKLGLPFDIDASDVVIPATCPILGIPLVRSDKGWTPDTPSLDRFRPELGYVKGNVWVISAKANVMKNNANAKELQAFAEWVLRSVTSDPKEN